MKHLLLAEKRYLGSGLPIVALLQKQKLCQNIGKAWNELYTACAWKRACSTQGSSYSSVTDLAGGPSLLFVLGEPSEMQNLVLLAVLTASASPCNVPFGDNNSSSLEADPCCRMQNNVGLLDAVCMEAETVYRTMSAAYGKRCICLHQKLPCIKWCAREEGPTVFWICCSSWMAQRDDATD